MGSRNRGRIGKWSGEILARPIQSGPISSKPKFGIAGRKQIGDFGSLKFIEGTAIHTDRTPNSITSHQPTKRKRLSWMCVEREKKKKEDRSPRVRRIARIVRIAAYAGVRSSSSVTSCLMTAQSGNCRFCVRACFRPRWYLPMALCHNPNSGPQTIARRLAPRQECSWDWIVGWKPGLGGRVA